MSVAEMSTDFYCEMFDHMYDNGYDPAYMFPVIIMGGEL